MGKKELTCACGKVFHAYDNGHKQRYCSLACYNSLHDHKESYGKDPMLYIEIECVQCHKKGLRYACIPQGERAFCSSKCWQEYRHTCKNFGLKPPTSKPKPYLHETVTCLMCGTSFDDLKTLHRKYCSVTCKCKHQRITLRGKNNPNFKAIKCRPSLYLKRSIEWKEWRQKVFEKDNYTCVACSNRGYIEPHHLKSKQVYPELTYEVMNGVTLCGDCHNELHRLMPASQYHQVDYYPLTLILK